MSRCSKTSPTHSEIVNVRPIAVAEFLAISASLQSNCVHSKANFLNLSYELLVSSINFDLEQSLTCIIQFSRSDFRVTPPLLNAAIFVFGTIVLSILTNVVIG